MRVSWKENLFFENRGFLVLTTEESGMRRGIPDIE
jgi:hypothetical protein